MSLLLLLHAALMEMSLEQNLLMRMHAALSLWLKNQCSRSCTVAAVSGQSHAQCTAPHMPFRNNGLFDAEPLHR